jgi:PAS domain S-box-containing protein
VFFGTDILREGALMNNYLSISPKDVFEMIPIGIAVLNEQLNTTYINSVFTEITRYELSELPGLPLTDILFELDQANQLMPQIVALATGDSIHRIIQLESKYHEYKSVLLTISPYTNNEDRGYILSVYDITELEKEKKHIQEQAQIAVDAQIAEEQFLARMSHEIRTAMNGIIGLTNVMIQSGLSGEQRQFLNLIKQSTDNLLVIINDILDLSKIKSGKMQFEEVPVQLKVLFENLYSIVLSKLGAKEIHLKLDFDQDIPTQLNTDPTRINQILLNLLGNAIKFTDRGQITYSAKLLGKQDDKARILIEVSDTGIGIDDKNIDLIFDSYKQAESDTTRKYGGTGLGLPIVKQLVELMGGHISVRSALNKGTTFSIELPLTISEEQIVQAETESKGPDIPEGIRVLVVDDNYINRLLVVHLLKAKGFDVLEASGGYEALDILQEEDIDLILMDISMPDIDGFETTRIIRKSDKAYIRQIPVIAMTAHGFQDQIRNARDAGMDNYIVKPFKPEQLYQLIIDQLEITKGPSENEDKLDQSDKINQQIHHTPKRNYNLAFLEDYYDHEPGFINNILKLYVQDTPEMLQEMTACISNNDWKQFKALAHKIKTNIMMMGIEPVDEFFKASSAMDPLDTGQASIRLMFQAFKQIVKDALEQIIADRKLNS